MREEITEPQHWRGPTGSQRNNSWTTRRRSQQQAELAADAVDAALADEATETTADENLHSADIIATLSNQLDLLEKQREQIQKLLEQAQTG